VVDFRDSSLGSSCHSSGDPQCWSRGGRHAFSWAGIHLPDQLAILGSATAGPRHALRMTHDPIERMVGRTRLAQEVRECCTRGGPSPDRYLALPRMMDRSAALLMALYRWLIQPDSPCLHLWSQLAGTHRPGGILLAHRALRKLAGLASSGCSDRLEAGRAPSTRQPVLKFLAR